MPRNDPSLIQKPTSFSREAGYIVIPIELWADKELPVLAKILVAEIESLSRKTGYCYAGNEYLAEFLNVTPGRISQLLTLLKKKGFIVEEGRENRFDTREQRRLFLQDSAINELKAAFRKLNYIYNSSKEELKDYIKPNAAKARAELRRKKSSPKQAKHYPSDSLEFTLTTKLLSLIRQWKNNFDEPDVNKWASYFDLMLNVKKWTYPRIEAVLQWWQCNDFWRAKGGGSPGFLLAKDNKSDQLWFIRFEMEMASDAKKGKYHEPQRKAGSGFGNAKVSQLNS